MPKWCVIRTASRYDKTPNLKGPPKRLGDDAEWPPRGIERSSSTSPPTEVKVPLRILFQEVSESSDCVSGRFGSSFGA